jgi:CopA family copper-resistance protein
MRRASFGCVRSDIGEPRLLRRAKEGGQTMTHERRAFRVLRPATTSRRRFIEGLAAGVVLTASGAWAPLRRAGAAVPAQPAMLRGTEFDLAVGEAALNLTGRASAATVVNGSLPAPTLRWREGDTVTLRVRNDLAAETSIHWHGILLPADMDGVPGLSFDGIRPGESFTYRFPVRQSGTYWYHAHSGFQEQSGLYGALVIDPLEPEPFEYDREHVVLLSDWTDRDPLDLYRLLKRQSGYFNYNDRTLGDLLRDSKRDGLRRTLADRMAWGEMRMKPSDVADIGGHGYTYLVNGQTPAANWTGHFEPGERVRLRIINGSAMSIFDVRIPGLEMTVVAADGRYVQPVKVDELRLVTAEVIDVLVEPKGADAFTIFAQSIDRAGYARGTLAIRDDASAPVPELDPVAYLAMEDMGHGGMNHATGASNASSEHAGHAPAAAVEPSPSEHAGHEHKDPVTEPSPAEHAGHEHAGHDMSAMAHGGDAGAAPAHPASETRNRGVDMQAMAPTARLDDPGIGLRNNGRRVLTYADLRSSFPDPDGRTPGRTIELHLTGHMERFLWSFDGVPFSGAEPIVLQHGERVRFVLVNDTMMTHPIHLHGLWSDLEDEHGEFLVRKHTLSIPPGTRRAFRVTADALGPWAFHCHLLFHMEAGMFRVVRVEHQETDEHHDHGTEHEHRDEHHEHEEASHDHAAHQHN